MEQLNKVEQLIRDEQLLADGDTVVVAVSGGPDSVALLHLLHSLAASWNWKLITAHVNHMFRGAESDKEAEFVTELSRKLSIPCEIGVINVPQYISEYGINPQSAAREKRYHFLHQVADKYEANKIALAHHADDQAETMLMRIIRGTGPSGLIGIPLRRVEKKVELVRPLLRIYKSEIENYCDLQGLSVCRDSSNEERKYFRNRIRLDVMPFLKKYNQQLPESLNRLSEMAKAEDGFLELQTKSVYREAVTADGKGFYFSRNSFQQQHVALQRRLIKLILSYIFSAGNSSDFTTIELIRSAIAQEGTSSLRLDINGLVQMIREYDRVGLVPFVHKDMPAGNYTYTLDRISGNETCGELFLAEAERLLSYHSVSAKQETAPPAFDLNVDKREALFDLDKLAFPLTVRNRRDGDRMEIIGLNGSKKVKDMFIDEKIAPSERNRMPILVDAQERLLWVPGVRRSKYALVDEQTVRVLHMKLN